MSKCKICKESWKKEDIIYKDGMCIVCYYRTVNWLDEKDTNQKSIEEYLEV